MNIGVDFGTTFSTFARYNNNNNTLEIVDFGEAEKSCVPSIVAYDNKLGNYSFGSRAQKILIKQGESSTRYNFYKAFKMLLPEQNKELLSAQGYSAVSPIEISEKYLGNFLNIAKPNNDLFNKMVICVPEIWNGSNNTLDGRNNLRKVCSELNVAKKTQIVTEPEAASAYFVYNYEQEQKHPFSGYVLTVDYGGGTLDITLTKAKSNDVNGKHYTQLTSIARAGRGENHDGKVGAAGIAFMEGIINFALRDAGLLADTEDASHDIAFFQATCTCEDALLAAENQRNISQAFAEVRYDYDSFIESYSEEVLEIFPYGDEDVEITYKHIMQAYEAVIHPVLDSALNDIIQQAKISGESAVDLQNPDEEVIYALVGGFGRFCMVEHQVYRKFSKMEDQISARGLKSLRENAVALGAALIADDVVRIQPIAEHSLGIKTKYRTSNNKEIQIINYGIRYGQLIEPNTIYYIKERNSSNKYAGFSIGNNSLREFAVGSSTDYSVGFLIPLRPTFQNKLRNLPQDIVAIGFSQDEDGVVHIHFQPIDMFKQKFYGNPLSVELSTYNDLFDLVNVKVIEESKE